MNKVIGGIMWVLIGLSIYLFVDIKDIDTISDQTNVLIMFFSLFTGSSLVYFGLDELYE